MGAVYSKGKGTLAFRNGRTSQGPKTTVRGRVAAQPDPGAPKIKVGYGACGIAAGAREVYDRIVKEVGDRGAGITVEKTGCIGMCYQEPLVEFSGRDGEVVLLGRLTPELIPAVLDGYLKGESFDPEQIVASSDHVTDEDSFFSKQNRIVLSNCGRINPEDIEEYIAVDGYKALEKALERMTAGEVVDQIMKSGLRGRGGAGFPTGLKWKIAASAKNDVKYIVCNADEGDPGAFMDRSVLESDPHAVIEGMIIGAYAIGAREGYIYCRAEYPLAIHRLHLAIAQSKERNFLGENILGTPFSLDIRVKEGAGAFVCGEETALMASIEGNRGMPRLRPPFPAERGIWGKPTNINNVETYANVPRIILRGADWYAGLGTEKSKGTKVFALAGKIRRGGLIEVPMGMTLKEIVFDIGGGIKSGKEFKAVQMGGPSGGCIPKDLVNTVIDYDSVTQTGAIMGSGGMVVVDEDTCMVDLARYFLEFTQNESCGKCTFCRVGTKRMLEILEKITRGEGRESDLDMLQKLAVNVKMGSLCGLGQTAPNPVLTTLRYFRHEYEIHIREKRCPAKQCRSLITFRILDSACVGCGVCLKNCPVKAITGERKQVHVIDQKTCIKCGLCYDSCKFSAITIE
jgi:NADH-quinone oxidoreductase subunit F